MKEAVKEAVDSDQFNGYGPAHGMSLIARVHNIIGGRVSYFSIACINAYSEVMMQYLEEFQ